MAHMAHMAHTNFSLDDQRCNLRWEREDELQRLAYKQQEEDLSHDGRCGGFRHPGRKKREQSRPTAEEVIAQLGGL